MRKRIFIQLSDSEKILLFNQISGQTGLSPFAVEKDWWVVQTLANIFELEVAKHLVFKGGTSLSKAWKLIDRFSEDVDLAIDREFLGFSGELSKSQRTELRKAASNYISGPFLDALKAKFIENGFAETKLEIVEAKDSDQDPRIIEIHYPNLITAPDYLQPKVLVEIGCRSLIEPLTESTFGSLIDEIYAESIFAEQPIKVPTVNPERTFLEKVFLLHEEFQKPIAKIRVDRLSRHLYDVYYLSKTEFANIALNSKDLYETIVSHRHKFTKIGGIDYNLHNPKKINPTPIIAIKDAWKRDYNLMLEQMIYEPNPPTFEMVIDELENLKSKLRNLEWEFELEF
jgi:hypothetical protein